MHILCSPLAKSFTSIGDETATMSTKQGIERFHANNLIAVQHQHSSYYTCFFDVCVINSVLLVSVIVKYLSNRLYCTQLSVVCAGFQAIT